MVIIGAGGLATEILEILKERYQNDEIFFFDNINKFKSKLIYNQFRVLTTREEVQKVFKKYGNSYCIGVGGIQNKLKLINLFDNYGGELNSVISSKSFIGSYNVNIGKGSIVFPGVKISNSVSLGKACLVYYNSVITHECVIGDFCEISPSVNVLGKVIIGNKVWLGSNSTVMPKIKIGDDVLIGSMALVTKNVKDDVIVVGIPAKSI